MSDKTLCIYHGNCADGFAAAWVVRKALGESNVEFYPGVYQSPPPDVTSRDVIFVDFSYKRPVMEQLVAAAQSITVLDHHKTAAADLEGLDANVVFDMERSGARIAWDYFFPEAPPPMLINHIQDRDLWRFDLAKTREIQANVFSYPYDFAVWDMLMVMDSASLADEGAAIERKHFKDIEELLTVTTREMQIGGYRVPVANLPYTMVSDAAHKLAEHAPFAACYWDTPKGRVFGLRSTDTGVDVSAVAKQYGGGGHAHASGFTVSFDKAREFEVTP